MRTRARFGEGFTLIELLVVIAIGVLILGLLVPALSGTRSTARTAVCLSVQRHFGIAMAEYGERERFFVPGPHTSGINALAWYWTDQLTSNVYTRTFERHGFDNVPAPASTPEAPVTPYDWMSPILAPMIDLPVGVRERFRALLTGDLACPANNAPSDILWIDGKLETSIEIAGETILPGDVPMGSYSSPYPMHVYYNRAHKVRRSPYTLSTGSDALGINLTGELWDSNVDWSTSRFQFTTDSMGDLSAKVIAYDGARYIDQNGQMSVSFTVSAKPWGDLFMSRSPVVNIAYDGGAGSSRKSGNPHRFLANTFDPRTRRGLLGGNGMIDRHVYRHPGNSITLSFYDGHAERRPDHETRRASLYFPTGSTVRHIGSSAGTGTGAFGDPTLNEGDRVP
ncbi:MAG: type II secretion system protein [Planctomycetota bacterium]